MEGPTPLPAELGSAGRLVRAAVALGAETVAGVSPAEQALVRSTASTQPLSRAGVKELRELIAAGFDPLGDAFCRLRAPDERRELGATYTPGPIVEAMMAWAFDALAPTRVIDPGAGSGRFSVSAGRRFPAANLVAVEVDPLAALLARAHLAGAGMASRSRVILEDFRALSPEAVDGPTLYVGNPPYVRHHLLGPDWKDWLTRTARQYGHEASQLAGLHVHFFLATLAAARAGDVGAYITSAEWLDVNYGSLVRELLLNGLGGLAVHVLEPTAMPFSDAATTGAISCFVVGTRPRSVRLRRVGRVDELGTLGGGRLYRRERLIEARRWTPLLRAATKVPAGYVELGELCSVHRGAVTGSNATWVTRPGATRLPDQVLFPSVTRARELFSAGAALASSDQLRLVVDLPIDLDIFATEERRAINQFLRRAKKAGAADGYIARYRRAWWSVGLREPAPILATYMARRPPAFVRNLADARHINIAHGLYPRQPLSARQLDRLAMALRTSISVAQGRTYAGGLTKFEPKEMERLPVPDLATLRDE